MESGHLLSDCGLKYKVESGHLLDDGGHVPKDGRVQQGWEGGGQLFLDFFNV